MKARLLPLSALLSGLIVVSWSIDSRAQIVLDQEEAAKTLAIRNVTATPSLVSGEIVNRTPHLARDIELVFPLAVEE